MMSKFNGYRQRIYASLLILGASFLLYRTITMIYEGALEILVVWAGVLLIAEMVVDLGFILVAIPWWISNNPKKDKLSLRFAAAAVILHAIRVLIFVLGRTGPWMDFDVRPEHQALHYTRWTWNEVYFAGMMALLSVIVMIIIWRKRKNK